MASIFSLYGNIFVDNEKANKSIDETTKKGKDSSKSFTESFTNVTKKAMAIGTAVVGATTAVVGSVTAMATQVADTAGSIDDSAKKVGMSAEEYQKWVYAAKLGGMEASTLEKAMIKQQKAFSDAKEGSASLSEAYKRLGIDIQSIGSSDEAFTEVINSLADMEDETTRNALANDIFGKSYAELAPLLAEGSEGIEKLRNEAVELGGVMSNESVEAGASFGDQLDKIKTAASGLFNNLVGSLLPVLSNFMQIILDNMPVIQTMVNSLAPILINTLQLILPIFIQLCETLLPIILDILIQLLPPMMQIIEQLLPIFTDLLGIILPPLIQIIQQLLPAVMPIIQALLPLITPLLEMLSWAIENVLMPVINVLSSIAEVISKVLVGALKALSPVLDGVKKIFEKVFGGIFNVVKAPINFVIDGINTFIKALNKIKIPDWVPAVGGKGINIPLIKKLRVGMENVPYDEMPALLHKGEAVLTADEAKEYRKEDKTSEEIKTTNYYNTINIDKVEVREDNDIKRIAEELYYLQQKREV